MSKNLDNNKKWFALYVLCLGSLMIVLDATIVNVALPSIRTSLGFSESSLAWVVNAYLLTFGGLVSVAVQAPAGAVIDATRRKRTLLAISLGVLTCRIDRFEELAAALNGAVD